MRKGIIVATAVGLALAAAGCSSSSTTSAPTPKYQEHGPYEAGVTTLSLGSAGPVYGERLATVFYPATKPTDASAKTFSYTEAETLPPALRGVLPAKFDTTQPVDAYESASASKKGPFPVLLFSHGFGGERLYYSNLLAGIASWGYVVVSADYSERGLASQAIPGAPKPTKVKDQATLAASLAAVEAAGEDQASPLAGIVDAKRVATAGHSAGGGTAFDALRSNKIATAIGWAPVPPTKSGSTKPIMIISAEGDAAIKPAEVRKTYASFQGPKSLIMVAGEGHNTYTDICVGIRDGGGLINFAVANGFTSAGLAKLGINGCEKKDKAPERFWPIVQYYTVLQLKNVFGGHSDATVPAPPDGAFPEMTVTVTQDR
jgi:dienelactone hydrolase